MTALDSSSNCAGPRQRAPLLESKRPRADGDVVVDCSRWRLCGGGTWPLKQQGTKQRVNGTVTVVLVLFTYIWATTVFVAVRHASLSVTSGG